MQILKYDALSANVSLNDLTFRTTQELIDSSTDNQPHVHGWIAQAEAKKAAMFGLNMRQSGFNVLVLGQHGSGRTSLMQSAMNHVAKSADNAKSAQNKIQPLMDLVALFNFKQNSQPVLLKLPVGAGVKLFTAMEAFTLALMGELPNLIALKDQQQILDKANEWLPSALKDVSQLALAYHQLKPYESGIRHDVLMCLKAWQLPANNDLEGALDSLMSDGFLARFRVNLLVDNRSAESDGLKQALVYDNDPTYQSLFGSLESASDQLPDFLRLRAGNLHKADGGMLQIQLRDLLNDEQNGGQIIEKLYRFLRNGTLQFEDAATGTQGSGYVLSNTLIPLKVKLVLIAMREDFYNLLEENPDFFDYFPIKVEFADSIIANAENYAAIAGYIAQKCEQHQCQHFTAEAVAALIAALQRLEEDQARISTNFAFLERLLLESASHAGDEALVSHQHVQDCC
jgi:hypothetical protein